MLNDLSRGRMKTPREESISTVAVAKIAREFDHDEIVAPDHEFFSFR
jgi:hypothetical protein